MWPTRSSGLWPKRLPTPLSSEGAPLREFFCSPVNAAYTDRATRNSESKEIGCAIFGGRPRYNCSEDNICHKSLRRANCECGLNGTLCQRAAMNRC